MEKSSDNILIIGGPNAGKTHFGGQLYGRLESRKFEYKIAVNNKPTDLSIFQEVLDNLAEGKRAHHTEASANKSIELITEDSLGNNVIFSFPDYAGEQVKMIVNDRRVNSIWKDYIDKSTSWVLFIRLHDIQIIEDIINRGIPNPEELQKRKEQIPLVKISDAAHFVELLQTLIYIKGLSVQNKIEKPNLTIVISCWDLLGLEGNTLPSKVLEERLTLLYDFVTNNWKLNSLRILGLSSTEKTLTDDPDDDFIDQTPVKFGYIINSKGELEKDLTLSINTFIGKD